MARIAYRVEKDLEIPLKAFTDIKHIVNDIADEVWIDVNKVDRKKRKIIHS